MEPKFFSGSKNFGIKEFEINGQILVNETVNPEGINVSVCDGANFEIAHVRDECDSTVLD